MVTGVPQTQPVMNLVGPDWLQGSGGWIEKLSPHTGEVLSLVARSGAKDIDAAVLAARAAQPAWAAVPPVRRGEILHAVAMKLRERREEMVAVVAAETGKSPRDARGETDGAVALGIFMAGEGQRLYGRTTTSSAPSRRALTIRQPAGVAGLIIAANTPIANAAWKVFPALICGNAAILKAAEDTPGTAALFGRIALEAGLPPGVLNIVQGLGGEAGAALVQHPDVAVISFTGSTAVGRHIAGVAGARLAKISLELGGKNPFIVCDDADIDNAVKWAVLSAFSNAGQRCAAGSRLIVFDAVYDEFRDKLIAGTKRLRVGPADEDDFGPVINEKQLSCMIETLKSAVAAGARVLTGGHRLDDDAHRRGFYVAPTIIENAGRDAEISQIELFGPIACLYRVRDFAEALEVANDSPYGLTACIHTASIHRSLEFVEKIASGVAIVNAGTYGSEPHMPFGGVKQSGNGSREPGTEALDIYSNLKDVYITIDPGVV